MSFRVVPSALETFSGTLTTLSGDAKKGRQYVEANEKNVKGGRGHLLGYVYTMGVVRIGDAVKKNLDRLDSLSSASGTELHKCAEVYRHTEKKTAERVDAVYPK
ncbi:hypothetical protein F8568_041025 [Actinomadura sp. LD22]|uniref:Excreted virulence factor EspC, type VII ESX diderm n=1 Tax=Actinomadura physcomitrii TaxID=2650748 RepID=A0A6I4MPH2_9ACTN|nr:hypothetical protein [Actinomadura physcomitrii]MWA06625.1 hypothetical protein [Actinomadura physcomitrii]